MGKHKCPIDGCPQQCDYHILMCRFHWSLVDRSTQQHVNQSWRNINFYPEDVGVRESYLLFRQRAIDQVNKKISDKAAV